MPYYTMQDQDTLEQRDVYFSPDEAPDWGTIVKVEGRRMVRLLEPLSGIKVDYGSQSVQARKWDPDAPAHDKKGRPQFKNKAELKAFCSKKNDKGGQTTYDIDS